MVLEVRGHQAAGVPEVMTPERVVSDETQLQGRAGAKGVCLGSGLGRGRVVVCGLGEEAGI